MSRKVEKYMKLVTYIEGNNSPQLGILKNEHVINLFTASKKNLPNDMLSFLILGQRGMDAVRSIIESEEQGIPERDVKLLAPIGNPSKIVALGLNYQDHVLELGLQTPKRPTVFCKFPSSIIGTEENICWPEDLTAQVDFEAELAFIIGKEAKNVNEEDAFDYIAGYTNCHDVSARDIQLAPGDQWIRGKSLDTFCPLGPYLVTKDEVVNPHNLDIKCIINGEIKQNSNTKNLIFNIPFLVSFLSRSFTLYPGDVVITGTPGGVGLSRKPPLFLKHGDECIVEVEGMGKLINKCVVLTSIN